MPHYYCTANFSRRLPDQGNNSPYLLMRQAIYDNQTWQYLYFSLFEVWNTLYSLALLADILPVATNYSGRQVILRGRLVMHAEVGSFEVGKWIG